jgi:hypothetical protein
MFDFLSSTKRPKSGTPVLSPQEVRDRIQSVNRPTAPYRIVDGVGEGVDLIAEWKIVDAQWSEIFGKAGLSKVFRIYLKLDEKAHEVRASDREYTVSSHLRLAHSRARCNRLNLGQLTRLRRP